jgi:hypothetical protein
MLRSCFPKAAGRAKLLVALSLLGGCSGPRNSPAAPIVGFSQLFQTEHVVPLAVAKDPLASPAEAALVGPNIVILDSRSADIKVFSRADGALKQVIGRAGDAPGEFRHPIAIAPFDSGHFVVYDQTRRVLSLRDSSGAFIEDSPLIKGFFNGMVALPEHHRVLLAGMTTSQLGDAKDADLHEFDLAGHRSVSFAKTARLGSKWADRLAALFAIRIGDEVVTGSLNSNRIRLYALSTGRTRWIAIAPRWYREPEWPSDALLQRTASSQTVAERVTNFIHTQRLMNGAFPLTNGRFLVRFMAFTSPTDKAFYYAIADTSGRTYVVSRATRANVVATRADTVFWVHPGQANDPLLGSGVVDAGGLMNGWPADRVSRSVASR